VEAEHVEAEVLVGGFVAAGAEDLVEGYEVEVWLAFALVVEVDAKVGLLLCPALSAAPCAKKDEGYDGNAK
jgi:hypothetical protein